MLTERQERILEFIYCYAESNGYVPSIREICDNTQISSTSVVTYYMKQLESIGYLIKAPVKSRAYRLTDNALSLLGHANPETDILRLQQQVQFLKAENAKLKHQVDIQTMQLTESPILQKI